MRAHAQLKTLLSLLKLKTQHVHVSMQLQNDISFYLHMIVVCTTGF